VTIAETLYVYGIVPADAAGDWSEPVRALTEGRLAALVSPWEGDAPATREDLARHDRVLGEAVERTTVVPMRFGVVMDDEETVAEVLLRRHAGELEDLLRGLEGHVQMTLRAYYREDVLLREVIRADPRIARAHERLRGRPDVQTQGDRIAIGQMVAAGAARLRQEDERMLLDRVTPLVAAVRTEEPANERIAIDAQLLVHRDRRQALDDAVGALSAEQEQRLALRYVGPIPPYSFADVALEA
jgi:hypothetical protein